MTEQRFSVPSAPTKTAATQRTSQRAQRAIRYCASSSKLELRRNAETFDQKQEGLRERLIPRSSPDLGPVELLAYGANDQQQWREIAVVLGQGQQLGDHDGSWRQHRNPDTQDLLLERSIKQSCDDRNPSEPMEYVHQRRFLGRFLGAIFVVVRLEEPVFRWSLYLQSRRRQAVRGHLDVSLCHNKIDIVDRLWAAVNPQRVAAAQCEGNAVGFQG